jgi:cell division protein FtsN
MRIIVVLIVTSMMILSSCAGTNKRLRKGGKTPTDTVNTRPPEDNIKKAGTPIKEVEETLVKNNDVSPGPSKYFVIIGSFRDPDNAKKHQSQIKNDGFSSEILKNSEGLYRVSVLATDDVTIARNKVRKIWADYPKYSDTWLLIQKK